MSFRLLFLPRYERCIKRLDGHQKEIAGLIVLALLDYFNLNLPLTGRPHVVRLNQRSYRLVFKKLRGQIWEAYLEGQLRVLTRVEDDKHSLVFAGNHDQVRQFLKEN